MLEQLRDGRIGRVPVWAIGVALAAAIIVFVVIRNRVRVTGDDVSGGPAEGEPDSVEGIPTQSFADQISSNYPSNPVVGPHLNKPVTNAQWLILAFDYLVGLAKDPGLVQRALQNYLSGKTLTAEEQQTVNLALANSNISLPPEGVTLPGSVTNPPPPPPPPAPERVAAPIGVDLYDWCKANGYDFVRLFGNFKGDSSALNPTHRNYMEWLGPTPKSPRFKPGTPDVKVR